MAAAAASYYTAAAAAAAAAVRQQQQHHVAAAMEQPFVPRVIRDENGNDREIFQLLVATFCL